MAFIRSSFYFLFGMYVAQNYNVPDIQRLVSDGLVMAKYIEEACRKPEKRDSDNEKRSSD